jgi:hypothetical protein
MRGHVRKRGSKWCVVVDLGRDEHGKRRREWHSGYETKRDAEAARVEILGRLQRGEHVAPSKLTVAAFLEDRWLPARESTLRPSTHESYAGNVRTHVIPAIGGHRLQALDAGTLTTFYGERLKHGLSARTLRYCTRSCAWRLPTPSGGASSSAMSPTAPRHRPRRQRGRGQ